MANERSTPGEGSQGQTMGNQGTQDRQGQQDRQGKQDRQGQQDQQGQGMRDQTQRDQQGQDMGQGQGQYRDDRSTGSTSSQPNVGQSASTSPSQTPRDSDMGKQGSATQDRTKTSGIEGGSDR